MKNWRVISVVVILLLLLAVGTWVGGEAERFGSVDLHTQTHAFHASLPIVALVLLIVFVLGWLLLNLALAPLRAWRSKRDGRARGKLIEGLHALHLGQWQQAEKLLRQAAFDGETDSLALVHAARAANARGDDAATQTHLQSLESVNPQAHAIARAEIALAQRQPQAALDALQASEGASSPPRALTLRAQALAQLGRAAEAQQLLPAIKRERALSQADYDALAASLAKQAALESSAPVAARHDENGVPRLPN